MMTKHSRNFTWLIFSFLKAFLVFLSFSSDRPASAACVDVDASSMLAIYPRNQPPPIQENNIESNQSDRCFGNVSATTNNQVHVGDRPGQVIQQRDRSITNDTPNNPLEGTRIDTPNIETHIDQKLAIPVPFDLIPK
jgi:hypothetical protein